jgi:tRNA (guanine37-N1)-methyltransferase
MLLRPEPIFAAVAWIRDRYPASRERVVVLSPQGASLDHDAAVRLSGYDRVVILCGRYEGIDERVHEGLADEEIRVGDAVLTGGETPAIALIDAVSRHLPGVLGNEDAASRDSFARGALEFPQYTRPRRFRDLEVPGVLLSGDHGEIGAWRERKASEATRSKRPDLLEGTAFRTAPSRRERG